MFRLVPSSDISERDLVERCLSTIDRTAQRSAQRHLYERYKRAMFSTAYRITNDYDNANDALQDAFVSVFRNLNAFAFQSTLGAWIKTIVVRNAIRKQQLENRFVGIDGAVHDQPSIATLLNGRSEIDGSPRTIQPHTNVGIIVGADYQLADRLSLDVRYQRDLIQVSSRPYGGLHGFQLGLNWAFQRNDP